MKTLVNVLLFIILFILIMNIFRKESFTNPVLKNQLPPPCSISSIVKPGNYYPTDFNTSNFTSNVINVHKFYKQNPPEISPINYAEQPIDLKQISEQTCYPNRSKIDSSNNKPDIWNYKNELPMNGGKLGKVVGYNNLENAYADFADQTPILFDDNMNCNVKPDDIRFGLGYPNKRYEAVR